MSSLLSEVHPELVHEWSDNPDAAAVTQVWAYIGELLFNMLVLVGAVKMSDRIIREMMGL